MRLPSICAALLLAAPLAQAQTACPGDFTEFLARFEGNAAFQRSNTRFPLSAVRTDNNAVPEPKTEFYAIQDPGEPRYADAVFPGRDRQAAAGLKQRIRKGSGARFVQLTQEQTGQALRYTFELSAGCWKLIKFENLAFKAARP